MRKAFILALACIPVLCQVPYTPVYFIGTVAGSGPDNSQTGGYAGDGGPAGKALLNLPTSVGLDGEGNLYFCDWNARIRKVDARTGVVKTIAGIGQPGFSGDGGPAINAQLGGPGNILVDSAGDIYFADVYNHRIRHISAATHEIKTIAGNGSQMESPDGLLAVDTGISLGSGMAVDRAGNLYFPNGSDRVRRVSARTGIVSTIAGAGGSRYSGDGGPATQAQLDQPSSVAIDARGDIYIAARGEHRIRKVDAETGIITTVAGSSPENASLMGIGVYQGGFAGDGGPATQALLNDPEDITLDRAGNLYISDVFNYRIRRVDAHTGRIETIAGTGVRAFSGDGGLATKAEMTTPSGLVADFAGRIFFGDLFNQRIRVLVPTRF